MTKPIIAQIEGLPAEVAKIATVGGYRNKIINGNFDIWQRGNSQTANGYGSVDRWASYTIGSTQSISRQAFTLGQNDVPGEPEYYYRNAVTSVAGAGNYSLHYQKIEGVRTLAGKTATFTFWAKADAAKDIVVEFEQDFGSGGSPSAEVNGLGVTTCSLTTSWQKFSFTVNLPSIAGKTIGSNGDDKVFVIFWFDAGSDFNSRTNSLGQQSGTFDIARVSLVEGDATGETDPFSPRHIGQEMLLCFRYYQKHAMLLAAAGNAWVGGSGPANSHSTYTRLRAVPTISFTPTSGSGSSVGYIPNGNGVEGFYQEAAHSVGTTAVVYLDAEL